MTRSDYTTLSIIAAPFLALFWIISSSTAEFFKFIMVIAIFVFAVIAVLLAGAKLLSIFYERKIGALLQRIKCPKCGTEFRTWNGETWASHGQYVDSSSGQKRKRSIGEHGFVVICGTCSQNFKFNDKGECRE